MKQQIRPELFDKRYVQIGVVQVLVTHERQHAGDEGGERGKPRELMGGVARAAAHGAPDAAHQGFIAFGIGELLSQGFDVVDIERFLHDVSAGGIPRHPWMVTFGIRA